MVERRQLDRSQSLVEGLTLFFLLAAVTAGAQPAVTGHLSNTTRVERWSYFQPFIDPRALPPPGSQPPGNPDYTFLGDRAELGADVEGTRFDLSGAFNYVRLENLPKRAIGPGGLGTGAFYFAASGLNYSYQLYMSGLSVRIKSSNARRSVTFGRMPFSSGAGDLLADRLSSRLIGNFESSVYQRRFDGARFDSSGPRSHFTAALFVPTQGGFEESTNLSMPRVQIGAAEWTARRSHDQYQLFAYGYRDRRRHNVAVVDNTGSLDRPVKVTVQTFGGSYARVTKTAPGQIDTLAWAAAQTGDWYGDSHRAASAAVEGGFRWITSDWRPWLRGGYLFASGDGDRFDSRHGTFFSMVPSSQQYTLSAVYAQMNVRDLFAQLRFEPRKLQARIEVHKVNVASGEDLWYQGSGATASHDRFFGFSGRSAGGDTSLGTIVEGAVTIPIRRYWAINVYGGTMSAGDVVRHLFTDKRLTVFTFENVIHFSGQ